jgi:hypothetical protein
VQGVQDHRKRFQDYYSPELNYNILQKLKKAVRPNHCKAFPLDEQIVPPGTGEVCFVAYCKVFGINKKRLDRLGKLAKEEYEATPIDQMEAARLAVLAHGATIAGGELDAVAAAQAALTMVAAGAASAASAAAAAAAAAAAQKMRKPYKRQEVRDPGAGNRLILPRKNASVASKQKQNLLMNVQGGALALALTTNLQQQGGAGVVGSSSGSQVRSRATQPIPVGLRAII